MAKKSAASNMRDIDDVPTNNNGGDNRRKPSDTLEIYQLPDGKYARLRPFGQIASIGGHWVKTIKKDKSKGSFYIGCSAWDPATAQRMGGTGAGHCAFCTYEAKAKADGLKGEEIMSRFSQDYFFNAILRSKQKAGRPADASKPTPEERSSGFKDKESESWTPVVPVRVTQSVIRSLKELKQLNTHDDDEGDTKAFSVLHAEYGCDVSIMKDKSKPAAQMYSVQKGEHTPITEAEAKYLMWDLSDLAEYPSEEEVQAEYDRWAPKMGLKASKKKASDEEDDDDDVPVKKSKKKIEDFDDEDEDDVPVKKSSAKKKKVDDFDDDDDDDEPAPKKKAPVKKKVSEDDEDDDLDDDEDDEPAPKKKAPAKKKPADDFDEDEDDDEPAPKKKAPAKKKPADDEDDFDDEVDDTPKRPAKGKAKPKDDDFDEDEDDDDEPAPKKKAPAKKPVKKARDEDEDDDLDDDEDDEPAPKPKKKPVVKKKPRDEDEDDDDL